MLNMTKVKCVLFISVSIFYSNWAFAHGNASGVVKERMDSMSSMAASMKTLTSLVRGKTEYSADTLRKEALNIATLSGPHLLEKFPENSISGSSEAKPKIWQQWSTFETYANELKMLATGLARSADNEDRPETDVLETSTNEMMNDMGLDSNMMDISSEITLESLSGMPTAMIFRKLNQNCTACHTDFRSEKQ